jgi:hypothetical protein
MATGGLIRDSSDQTLFQEDGESSAFYSEGTSDLSGYLDWDPVVKDEAESRSMARGGVEEMLGGAVTRLRDMLPVSRGVAQLLLQANAWDVNDTAVKYYADRLQLYRSARVPMPPAATALQECPACDSGQDGLAVGVACGHRYCTACWSRYIKKHINTFGPLICVCLQEECNQLLPPSFMLTVLSDEDLREVYGAMKAWDQCQGCGQDHHVQAQDDLATGAQCGHRYCPGCWHIYLVEKIDAGDTDIACPSAECTALLPEDFILAQLRDSAYSEKYQEDMLRANVTRHPKLHSCPGEKCKAIIYAPDPKYSGLYCEHCQQAFCAVCREERHFPCDCDTMQKWRKLCKQGGVEFSQHCLKLLECPKRRQAARHEEGECESCHEWVCFACQVACQMSDDTYSAECSRCTQKLRLPAPDTEAKAAFYYSKFLQHCAGEEKWRAWPPSDHSADTMRQCHRLLKYVFVLEWWLEDGGLERENLVLRRHVLETRLHTCVAHSTPDIRDLFSLEMALKDLSAFFSDQKSHKSKIPSLAKSLEALEIADRNMIKEEFYERGM